MSLLCLISFDLLGVKIVVFIVLIVAISNSIRFMDEVPLALKTRASYGEN